MSYHCFSLISRTAAKEHICIWCGQKIEKGEFYVREQSVYDGHFQNHAWHQECNKEAQEEFKNGESDFTAYAHERPRKKS